LKTFLEEAAEHLDAAGNSQEKFSKSNTKLRSFLNRVLGIKLSIQTTFSGKNFAKGLTFVRPYALQKKNVSGPPI